MEPAWVQSPEQSCCSSGKRSPELCVKAQLGTVYPQQANLEAGSRQWNWERLVTALGDRASPGEGRLSWTTPLIHPCYRAH